MKEVSISRLSPRRRWRLGAMPLAFTLIEMLVVMGIVAILAALTVPAFNSIARSHSLTTGGETVVAQLNLARQHAISLNRSVEVRFYRTPNSVEGMEAFDRMQLLSLQDDGRLKMIDAAKPLPEGVIIAPDSSYSPLLHNPGTHEGAATLRDGGEEAERSYVAFWIGPSARPSLSGSYQETFLTLWMAQQATSSGSLPSNYLTVQVNPGNSTVRVYRP